jgi:cupin 2 domain-containing protein
VDGSVTTLVGTLEPGDDDAEITGERIDEIARCEGFRIEHVTSGLVVTPVEFLQAHDEWVVVLSGSARLEVGGEEHQLGAGDWVLIPTAVGHRLLQVEPGTRWLAVHDRPEGRIV